MNLREIRKARGLTIQDLAELIGMDPTSVHRAEVMDKSAKITTYAKCAQALQVSLSDLFSDGRSELEWRLIAAFRKIPADQQDRIVGLLAVANPTDSRQKSE